MPWVNQRERVSGDNERIATRVRVSESKRKASERKRKGGRGLQGNGHSATDGAEGQMRVDREFVAGKFQFLNGSQKSELAWEVAGVAVRV